MLINDKTNQKNSKFSDIGNFIRSLTIIFIVFNASSMTYTHLVLKLVKDPVVEKKVINQMVNFHFISSVIMSGGFCLSSLAAKEEREK